jgi:hypothetical protein
MEIQVIHETRALELAATVGQWEYVCCYCFINTGLGISGSITYECALCHNTNLRFIHVLENLEDHRQIDVGIECARRLIDDFELPALAENEVKRKEKWRIYYSKPGRCVATVDDLKNRGKL